MFTPQEQASIFVTLVNEGEEEYSTRYDGNTYTVPSGGQAVVPFYVMCRALGHPDAVNVGSKRQDQFRHAEWERLQVMYGSYDNLSDGETKKGIPCWDEAKPRVKAYIQQGDDWVELMTVVADPEGEFVNHSELAQSTNTRTMQEQLANLQSQVAQLTQQLNQAEAVDKQQFQQGPGDVPPITTTTEKLVMPESKPVPNGGAVVKDVPNKVLVS